MPNTVTLTINVTARVIRPPMWACLAMVRVGLRVPLLIYCRVDGYRPVITLDLIKV